MNVISNVEENSFIHESHDTMKFIYPYKKEADHSLNKLNLYKLASDIIPTLAQSWDPSLMYDQDIFTRILVFIFLHIFVFIQLFISCAYSFYVHINFMCILILCTYSFHVHIHFMYIFNMASFCTRLILNIVRKGTT